MKSALACVFVLLAWSAAAQVARPETVTVSGSGKSTSVPDRVAFSVGVQTVADSVEAAVNQNNERVARVIAILEAAGALEQEIQTSRFSISPQHDHRQGAPPRIVGYQVSNTITVRTPRVGEAGRLLQAAIRAGANTASSLHYDLSAPGKAKEEAMRAAVADARAQAAVLAQAAGRALGRVLSISESAHAVPPPMPYARTMAMQTEASEVPVSAGTEETAYSVTVVFELR